MFLRTTACVATATAVVLAVVAPHAVAGEESFTSAGSWVVPAGVSVVQVNVTSGSGGDGGRNAAGDGPALGGLALTATAQVPVTPGERIHIGLGGNGQDSTSNGSRAASAFGIGPGGRYTKNAGAGGGGGGASAVAIDDDIILIAGGGGGAGGFHEMGGFPIPSSGPGGNSGAPGTRATPWGPIDWNIGACGGPVPEMGAGGDQGRVGTGDPARLTRSGTAVGGAGGDTAAGCNTDGGGGGAGWYGGLAGTGGGGDAAQSSGGGGGGGLSYASPSRVGGFWSSIYASRGSTPSGSIQYIDITTTALPDATAGTAFSTTLAAGFGTGGTVNQWSVSPALPTGLSLDSSTGVLSGTASAASSATYTFTASRVTGGTVFARTSVNLAFSVRSAPTPTPIVEPTTDSGQNSSASGPADVAPALSAVPPGVFEWQRGIDADVRVVTNAGSASRFSVEPALPSGLSINPTSGVIEGAPSSVHKESKFRITAVNAGGSSTAEIAVSVTGIGTSVAGIRMPPSVRFAPRSAKLTPTMKGELDEWFVVQRKTPVALTSVIPRSGKGASLARKRAVQVRKYLRSRDMHVDSVIQLSLAPEPMVTRRVLFTS